MNQEARKDAEADMAALTQARSPRGAVATEVGDLEGIEGRPGIRFVQEYFPDEVVRVKVWQDQGHVEVKPDRILEILVALRDAEELGYDFLVDIAGVDHLELKGYSYKQRFGVAYTVHSFSLNDRVRVKALVSEASPRIATASHLYGAANWLEREIYDMYGVEFDGHPNLIRILMPEYYEGHPLRKDYPLQGRGERFNFPRLEPEFRPEEPNAPTGIHRGSTRKRRDV